MHIPAWWCAEGGKSASVVHAEENEHEQEIKNKAWLSWDCEI